MKGMDRVRSHGGNILTRQAGLAEQMHSLEFYPSWSWTALESKVSLQETTDMISPLICRFLNGDQCLPCVTTEIWRTTPVPVR